MNLVVYIPAELERRFERLGVPKERMRETAKDALLDLAAELDDWPVPAEVTDHFRPDFGTKLKKDVK